MIAEGSIKIETYVYEREMCNLCEERHAEFSDKLKPLPDEICERILHLCVICHTHAQTKKEIIKTFSASADLPENFHFWRRVNETIFDPKGETR